MNEEIKKLTELQVIDLQIGELDAEINAVRDTLGKRHSEMQERQDSLADLQSQIEAAETRRRELESEHADELSRIKERQAKMMQVQTNREYQSILKEIEDAKKINKEREDETVRLMEKVESLGMIMKEQGETCKKDEGILDGEAKEVEKNVASLNTQKQAIVKKRSTKAKGFNGNLLKKYDMLRQRRNGRAVVGVVNGVCQGCYMSIPPQQFNELLRGDRMIFCPACQRILFSQAESEQE